MSGVQTLAKPHRIKAAHRRRGKAASGQSVQRYYDPAIGRFLSVDPVTADGNTGGNFNRYWYANNNPYKFKDPDGRYVETALDLAFIASDVADIRSNGLNLTNGSALVADVVGALLPGATGLGAGVKGIAAIGAIVKGADKAANAAKAANKASDAGKVANKAGDLSKVKDGKLKADGIDAHAVKKEAVGSTEGGKFNISVDKKTGDAYLTPVKKGASDPVPLNVKYDDLKK